MRLPILPATQTIAQLSPHTLVMELSTFSQREVDEALAGETSPRAAQILAHELTHWYDIVGTVWGQSYLDVLFQTYDRVLAEPPPSIFAYPDALRLFDVDRNILFPTYYKFAIKGSPRHPGPGAWQMEITTGVRVVHDGSSDETDPFLFVRFYEKLREVARQPINDSVLLEMRAVNAEVQMYRVLRDKLPDDERAVADALYSRTAIGDLYDPELTTYSAGAHLLSRAFPGHDVTSALSTGSRLAGFAMNLTSPLFQRLITPQELNPLPRRLKGFKDRANRGFLFACLCYHFRTLVREDVHIYGDDLDPLLRVAGLPPANTIHRRAREFIERRQTNDLVNSDLRRIRTVLRDAGIQILDARANSAAPEDAAGWAALPSPLIIDREVTEFRVGPPVLTSDDCNFLNDCHFATDGITRQALRAGRGFDFGYSDFVY